MVTNAIEVDGLVKKFRNVTAVDGISFEIRSGTTFALLGTNGAGKSTAISCITTLLKPTAGSARVAGHVVGEKNTAIRRKIGVVFQQSLLDNLLTVEENLMSRAGLYGMSRKDATSRIREYDSVLGIGEFVNRKYGKLSGGQRRRADIARALIHKPEILFLDEPTTGLDPDSRQRVWQTIVELQSDGHLTVFLTTHYLEEAQNAAMVCILDHGKIVASGTPDQLRAEFAQDRLRLLVRPGAQLTLKPSLRVEVRDGYTYVDVNSWQQAQEILAAEGSKIEDFEFNHGTLDDVFLNIAGKGNRP